MRKRLIVCLVCIMLVILQSCQKPLPAPPTEDPPLGEGEKNYNFGDITTGKFRLLYKAAVEGEDAYNATLIEICPELKYSRDQFLEAYQYYKNSVVAVLTSKRYIQSEFAFEGAGTEVSLADGTSRITNVDMMRQCFARRTDSCRAEGTFYSSASPEPIYDEPKQEMIQSGKFVSAATYTEDPFHFADFELYREGYHIKKVYIYDTYDYNLYYFYVYRDDGAYVGSFEFISYKEEGKLNNFFWHDFNCFSFMTLEEYVNQ